ncbi:MAG: ATP-binding protein, partial [Chitinivorax sp.]
AQHNIDISLGWNDNIASLIVDDDGPGIPEQERENVFQPFVRLDTSRDRRTGGYGLGLAIVNRIMQWHGGEVRLSQSPQGGARFELRWPSQLQARESKPGDGAGIGL